MVADNLVTQGVKASAAMVLIYLSLDIAVSVLESTCLTRCGDSYCEDKIVVWLCYAREGN